jgi:hypothetical protein
VTKAHRKNEKHRHPGKLTGVAVFEIAIDSGSGAMADNS